MKIQQWLFKILRKQNVTDGHTHAFARFDKNPAMTLQDIKETKRYGRTDARTDGQRENSIPTTGIINTSNLYNNSDGQAI